MAAEAGEDPTVAGQWGPRRRVPARLFLDEHEVRWEQRPTRVGDDEADLSHRLALVAEALRAYEQLRVAQAPDSDPATVFRRWPICARVALASAAPEDEFVRRAQRFFKEEDAANGSPTLRLDVATGLLVVEAPPGRKEWWSSSDGGVIRLDGARWIVPQPLPTVTLVDRWGNEFDLSLFDSAKPMLTFTESGSAVTDPPVGEGWVLARDDQVAAFGSAILELAPPPPGWIGWSRARVIHTRENSADLEWIFGETVRGLVDASGNPVYRRPPHLDLPTLRGACWTIEVRRAGEESPCVRIESEGGEVVDLADHLRLPALGRFHAVASLPRGKSIGVTFTVAEGVEVDAEPTAFRMLGDDGLRPAVAVIRSTLGVRAIPQRVRLLATQVAKPVELRTDVAVLAACVELPHAAIRRRAGGAAGEWGIHPVSYTEADLLGGAQLDVLLPDEAQAILIRSPGIKVGTDPRRPVQQIRGGRTGQVLRYNLAALLDTVRIHGSLRVWLDLPKALGVRLADITVPVRPRPDRVDLPARTDLVDEVPGAGTAGVEAIPLAPERDTSDATLDVDLHRRGSLLVVPRSSAPARVRVHLCRAPWYPPLRRTITSTDNAFTLPAPFAEGGPLLVSVARDGAGLFAGWPSEVTGVEVTRLECADLIPRLPDRGEQTMAAYLAGKAEAPGERGLRHLFWNAAAHATDAVGPTLGPLFAQECASRLSDAPTASLLALERSGLSRTEIVEPLIRSGLAAARIPSVLDPQATSRLWSVVPLAALLLSSPLLPYLSDDPMWSVDELEHAEETLLLSVVDRVDPVGLAVLQDPSGPLPTTDVLTLDPLPALDRDVPALAEPLKVLQDFAANNSRGRLMDAVRSRLADDPTVTVAGAVSLGIAIVARLAAQGDTAAAAAEPVLRDAWLQLARRAPGLVAADLSLADLLVAGWLVRYG
ncbi:MAG: hypothetical protein AB7V44_17135 [Pseudonocardia sp.]